MRGARGRRDRRRRAGHAARGRRRAAPAGSGCSPRRATVASGAYERAVRTADPHVHLESVACPDLAPIIQGGFPFDRQVVETVRSYCAPLRAAEVDTVILGCTHYPLVAPMLQRTLGRGVTLVTSGAGVARSVERALASRGLLNPRGEEGGYRFRCTGDVESFRALGTRFLQMPLERGRPRRARRGGCRHERDDPQAQLRPHARTSSGPTTIEPGFVRTATGSALISIGRDARDLHRVGTGERPALAGRRRPRLGDGRVRHAPRLHRRAQAARHLEGPARRPLGRDPAPDRPLAARRGRLRGARRAHDLHRLRRAPGRRRHALRLDHRRPRRAPPRVREADRRRDCSSSRR